MIRTKAYITREIKKLEDTREKLIEELWENNASLINRAAWYYLLFKYWYLSAKAHQRMGKTYTNCKSIFTSYLSVIRFQDRQIPQETLREGETYQ